MERRIYALLAIALLFAGCMQTTENIHIGVLVPLTGEAAIYGEAVRDGILLQQAQLQEAGTAVTLHFEDSQCSGEPAARGLKKLLSQYSLDVVIGTVCSPGTLSTHAITEAEGILHISPTASVPAITDTHVFRLYASDVYQAQIAHELMQDEGYKKLAIVHIDSDYGVALKDALEELWEGEVFSQQIMQGETDFRTELLKIEAHDPDVLYIIGVIQETGNMLRQMHELGMDIPVYGTESLQDQELLRIAGEGAEELVFVAAKEYTGDDADMFVDAHTSYFDREPGLFAEYGYDSLAVAVQAITETDRSYEEMKRYLERTTFAGATGVIDFDEKGDVQRAYKVVEVIDGEFVEIPK